ncbi:hypothetical protein B0A55_06143 [Friedmanniomyces simplex]|uniref:Alpha/beta hydrolase fold-3 domain-containing protein n=1 Tax=Friedmanniomyces simplex TaxID=329884 RepID=A0A4U0XQN8_9PEZI|nr:hypothetical protein B0A55_06143 [Friedmanniomyces simplex]
MSDLAASPKFAPFSVTDFTYKTVGDTPIEASILIPKAMLENHGKKVPLAVRFHGGFLVTGHRLFADWYPQFILDFCQQHGAIVITADYRLMPEAKGTEILDDIKDFYAWLLTPGNLHSHLPAGVEVDPNNLLVTGESAGGYLAFMSTLIAPSAIKAVVMHYPMLDLRAAHYTEAYVKHIFNPPVPQIPGHVLADYLAGLKGGEIVTSAIPLARVPLAMSMVQQGRFEELFGGERSLYPLDLLEDGAMDSVRLPAMWIMHGKQDSAVPVEGTHRFVEKLRESVPGVEVHVSLEEGEHGFDNHAPGSGEAATLETGWVAEGLGFVERYWHARAS